METDQRDNKEGASEQNNHRLKNLSSSEKNKVIEWSEYETNSREKTPDWYFILWTIAIAGAIISFMLNNPLFGILLIISAFTLSIYAARKPQIVDFSVSRRGIIAGPLLYKFNSIKYFAIDETPQGVYLLLQPRRTISHLQTIPLSDEVDTEELREFLQYFLEENHRIRVPAHQIIIDRLGF